MNDDRRQFGWGLSFLISMALWAVILLVGHAALAQVPNPVTPGYQICTTTSGVVKCSFQAVGSDSSLGVYGLPMGAKAVTTCGVESYTNGTPYVLEQDLTGALCINSSGGGGGGGAVTIADGADVTQGTKADAVCATPTGTCTIEALIKYLNSQISVAIPAGTNTIGKVLPSFGAAQLSSAVVSAASSGNNTLVTRVVGTIKVYGVFFSCASSVVATLQNGTSTGVTGAMTLTTFFLPVQAEPYFTTTSTNNFVLNLGSAVQCSGTIYYLDT